MKHFRLLTLTIILFAAVGCSKSDNQTTTVKPPSTPDTARLKSDSERLQQATANAAKEREKANRSAASATPSP